MVISLFTGLRPAGEISRSAKNNFPQVRAEGRPPRASHGLRIRFVAESQIGVTAHKNRPRCFRRTRQTSLKVQSTLVLCKAN